MPDRETDQAKIQQRLKQIGFGKNTVGYDNYIRAVPESKRKGYAEHPRTPDAYEKVSKRMFDGRIKAWRRAIHKWDDPTAKVVDSQSEAIEIDENTEDRVSKRQRTHEDAVISMVECATSSNQIPVPSDTANAAVVGSSAQLSTETQVDYDEMSDDDVL